MSFKIMGILNATPDSFSDGDSNNTPHILFQRAIEMIEKGADIIDIGGETTKPFSDPTPPDIELQRVLPVLKLIKQNFPNITTSIDTRKYEVAEECLKAGADMINDVSGLQHNPEIAELVAKYDASLVIMHSKETPKTMQNAPTYNDVVAEVYAFLDEKIKFAREKGVKNIIADVGIGFAKTTQHNITLLNNLSHFRALKVPLLLGISRKRFIGEITGISEPKERDTATMLFHSYLQANNPVDIIRVHNVPLAVEFRSVFINFNKN